MAKTIIAVLLAFAFATASPQSSFAEEPAKSESPEELAREGVEKLLQALDALVSMIPQYSAPEVLDNGDIIIRRVWPDDETDDDADVDETNA